ncbi:MAG: hypothetical protein ACTSW1_00615 [Candidatus Hodarchaeales archaeon]
METQQLVQRLEAIRNDRRNLELYVNYVIINKFLWIKIYEMVRNMVFSNIVDISARIQRVSNQYNALLELNQEIMDQGEAAILSNIQLEQLKLKIRDMREKIENLTTLPKLRRALEFYEEI